MTSDRLLMPSALISDLGSNRDLPRGRSLRRVFVHSLSSADVHECEQKSCDAEASDAHCSMLVVESNAQCSAAPSLRQSSKASIRSPKRLR